MLNRPIFTKMNHTEPLRLASVEKFREIALWPVQLLRRYEGTKIQNHWEYLNATSVDSSWPSGEKKGGLPGKVTQPESRRAGAMVTSFSHNHHQFHRARISGINLSGIMHFMPMEYPGDSVLSLHHAARPPIRPVKPCAMFPCRPSFQEHC